MRKIGLLATVTCALAIPAAAETKLAFKETGTSFIQVQTFDRGDGSKVQINIIKYVGIGTSGDMAGQTWSGECYGLGDVTKDGVYSGTNRCTAHFSDKDSMTWVLNDTAAGGDATITGGSGKYAGAKGTGHLAYTWGDTVFGDRITYSADVTAVLP